MDNLFLFKFCDWNKIVYIKDWFYDYKRLVYYGIYIKFLLMIGWFDLVDIMGWLWFYFVNIKLGGV